jgi:cytoskeletal protein CcmA (bactofilin family)
MPSNESKRGTAGRIVLAVACALVLSGPAAAIEFRGGKDVVVASDEVIDDDLYATGETVTVDGRVEGDVIASGGEIRLNGAVSGDFMAAGQAVVVDGRVGDDARIAGMALRLGPTASVGDDVVAAGMSLETLAGSVTGGSLLFAGMQALLAGEIGEALIGGMNGLEIQGRIGGGGEVEVGETAPAPAFLPYLPSPVALPAVPGGLTIGEGAQIEGRLVYIAPGEATVTGGDASSLVHEAVAAEGDPDLERESPWPGWIFRFVGLVLIGLLFAWLFPAWLGGRSDEIAAQPLKTAAIGLLGVVVLPVAILFALLLGILVAVLLGMVQLGGLAALVSVLTLTGIALLALLFWLTAAWLAPLFAGLCLGRSATGRFVVAETGGTALPLVVGLLALALLGLIPVLGELVALAVIVLGWGALLGWLWTRSQAETA